MEGARREERRKTEDWADEERKVRESNGEAEAGKEAAKAGGFGSGAGLGVDTMGMKREKKGKERKKAPKRKTRKRWSLENVWKWVFLILLVMRRFGVAKVASENLQSREVKIDTDCWTEEECNTWVE